MIATFYTKKENFSMNFPENAKTTERHSLAVWGSVFGEKQFLLIFFPFYWFEKKKFLNKFKFSSGFAPFKHGKKNIFFEYFTAHF